MQIAQAVAHGAHVISFICEWIRVADSAVKASKEEDGVRRAAHIVAASTLAVSSGLNTLAPMCQAPMAKKIRSLEIVARGLDVGGSVAGATADFVSVPERDRYSAKRIVRAIEQGLLAPIAGFVRSLVERNICSEEGSHDQNEMKDALISLAEMGFRVGTLTKTTREAQRLYIELCAYLFGRHAPPAAAIVAAPHPYVPPPPAEVNPCYGPVNLVDLPEIPLPLHEDVVFSQVICPITQCPVRDPVLDPTNHITIYERRAIVEVIDDALARGTVPKSPLTREPISVERLIALPHRHALITERLRFHQEHCAKFIQENLTQQVP